MFKVGDRIIHIGTWDKGTILATGHLDDYVIKWDDQFSTYMGIDMLMLDREHTFYQQLANL